MTRVPPPRASRLTDRASAATDSADRQRHATESRLQNGTKFGNAELCHVSYSALLGGGQTLRDHDLERNPERSGGSVVD